MNAGATVSPATFKEIRALMPVWVLCIVGLGGSLVWGENTPLAFVAYGVGVLALGAQSIGHEYSYRTLPLLLTQPVDRHRLLRRKAAVLVPMLLTVVAAAILVFPYANGPGYAAMNQLVALALPALGALLLAPWLTMLCRSVLAGLVFSIALPAVVMIVANVLVDSVGLPLDVVNVWLAAILMLCAVTGVLGWRGFMRLEAVEATSASLHFLRTLRPARPHHPLWMLTLKELRLQQLTFVLVGAYLSMWVLLFATQRMRPDAAEIPLNVLTPLYLLLAALLIGAFASAEERQLGTMEWQQMLPVAASRQWTVKVAVVFGLAMILAIVLPALLGWINNAAGGPVEAFRTRTALLAFAVTAGGLYISSLCRSGVHAAVLSIVITPVALAAYFFVVRTAATSAGWLLAGSTRVRSLQSVQDISTVTLGALLIVLLVQLAYVNHRSADQTTETVLRQLLLVLLCLAGWSVLFVAALIVVALY